MKGRELARIVEWVPKPLRRWLAAVGRWPARTWAWWVRYTTRVNPRAIFLFGNLKSGTTAIASLLARATGRSVTLDLFHRVHPSVEIGLLEGKLRLSQVVEDHKPWFAKDMVKEPGLAFFFEQLVECFPQGRFVFILRDPRDNIRSILNRLGLPGSLAQMQAEHWRALPTRSWEIIFEGGLFGAGGDNYIEVLSNRWNIVLDKYLANSERAILVRYEDFVADKAGQIETLARRLDLEPRHDVTAYLDVQYQPKGDRSVSWLDFFGHDNLARIERICAQGMRRFGYAPSLPADGRGD